MGIGDLGVGAKHNNPKLFVEFSNFILPKHSPIFSNNSNLN
ncbi:MAG: hypothetical protein VZQ49_06890 [Methanobrevibacter sp.]|nr:hypothetical protein [Methanobrevibacter sp.]